ncbi:Uncharacterised protein [Bordetella pertussis]|nr:Uncharacterised protein [Bordetella pertussis]
MICTDTTCPCWAPLVSLGGMRMSCLMRWSSGTTMDNPCSCRKRPTSLLVRRSMTSTMAPSGLPRYSPDGLTRTRSPCSTLSISRGDRKISGPPSSRTRKPKPSRWPCTRPATKSSLVASSSTPLRLGSN